MMLFLKKLLTKFTAAVAPTKVEPVIETNETTLAEEVEPSREKTETKKATGKKTTGRKPKLNIAD
jgi:hypothetical protein